MSYLEIFDLIRKIPCNKASGLDNISARLLKEAAPIVTHSLTVLINLSITTGIFRDTWKQAKVFLCLKKVPSLILTTIRPISVLPIVSKLIERVALANNINILVIIPCYEIPIWFQTHDFYRNSFVRTNELH